jgi:glycosyltransferase involved in cell wall biosynthesis
MSAGLKISAVIPAYNSRTTVVRAIASVLAQSRVPDEIIVVDDQSTDDTQAVVSALPSDRIRLVSTNARKGAGGARNVGIRAASGDIVAFLDSDDEWLRTKTEKQVSMLESDPRLSFVTCSANSISPAGVDLGDTYGDRRIAAGSEAWKALLACNFIATPSVAVWRRCLQASGGFDEQMKIGEDQDLWIRLALAGSLSYIPESLVRVHLRDDSLSSWALDDLLTYTLPMVERHLNEQSDRLSDSEVRQILGERLYRFGRVAYVRGNFAQGARLIMRSMMLGYRPAESALYLLGAAPPLVWMKRQFGLGDAG